MLKAMIDVVAADGEFPVSEKQRRLLVPVSPPTIDRLLKTSRKKLMLKGGGITKAGPLLKYQIPMKTYFAGDKRKPCFFELDTVSHRGTRNISPPSVLYCPSPCSALTAIMAVSLSTTSSWL
jgi:hypothetical protein